MIKLYEGAQQPLPEVTDGEIIFYQNFTHSHYETGTDMILDADASALRKIC